jgi:hypothetical protein
MSIVGVGQFTGREASALNHAGGEVMRVPCEFVRLAVMGMALVLVASTVANPPEVILTRAG